MAKMRSEQELLARWHGGVNGRSSVGSSPLSSEEDEGSSHPRSSLRAYSRRSSKRDIGGLRRRRDKNSSNMTNGSGGSGAASASASASASSPPSLPPPPPPPSSSSTSVTVNPEESEYQELQKLLASGGHLNQEQTARARSLMVKEHGANAVATAAMPTSGSAGGSNGIGGSSLLPLDFLWFDFHKECAKMQWHNLSRLFDLRGDTIASYVLCRCWHYCFFYSCLYCPLCVCLLVRLFRDGGVSA